MCQDKKESLVQAMHDLLAPSFWGSEHLHKSAEMKVQKEISLILKHLVRKYNGEINENVSFRVTIF